QPNEDLVRISFEMKTSENDNCSLMNKVEKFIGKATKESPTDLFMNAWKAKGVALRGEQAGVHRTQEFCPQPRPYFLIPQIGVGQIRLGFGPKNDLEGHPRLRILFLTSDQGEPVEGFLRKTFSRRLSSSFWEDVSFTA